MKNLSLALQARFAFGKFEWGHASSSRRPYQIAQLGAAEGHNSLGSGMMAIGGGRHPLDALLAKAAFVAPRVRPRSCRFSGSLEATQAHKTKGCGHSENGCRGQSACGSAVMLVCPIALSPSQERAIGRAPKVACCSMLQRSIPRKQQRTDVSWIWKSPMGCTSLQSIQQGEIGREQCA